MEFIEFLDISGETASALKALERRVRGREGVLGQEAHEQAQKAAHCLKKAHEAALGGNPEELRDCKGVVLENLRKPYLAPEADRAWQLAYEGINHLLCACH